VHVYAEKLIVFAQGFSFAARQLHGVRLQPLFVFMFHGANLMN
jgi:hypothetical protein